MTTCLEVSSVSKIFGGLVAVDKVNVVVPEKKIASIIGPNGAGKTTLFNCISGYYTPDKGTIRFEGNPIQGLSTNTVAEMGISRTYQNIRLFKDMTVLENILIGMHPHMNSGWVDAVVHTRRHTREESESVREALRLLDYVSLAGFGDTLARNMPYGAQRRLEIARALANHPRLLLLDEPTAGMNPQETDAMARFIGDLRSQLDLTIVLIEHDMRVVMGISDQISVLDHGVKIAEGTPAEIRSNPQVIEAYLGAGTEQLTEKYLGKKRHVA